MSEPEKTDVLLVGAGIMSATLSTLLRLVEPDWSMTLVERLDGAAAEALTQRQTDSHEALHRTLCGHIYTYMPPPLVISASYIRELLQRGESPRYLLPTAVLDDIMDAGVYQSQPATAASQ